MILFCHARDEHAWQVDALRRSIAQVGQRGELVVRSDEHPERWRYVILDRVLAFQNAVLEYASRDSCIAILDPDMVILRPLEVMLEPGRGLATRHQVMEDAGIAWQLSAAVPELSGVPTLVDWPVVLHIEDARRLAPVWLDITERAARDSAVASLFGWWLDMFSLAFAAHKVGIALDVSDPIVIVPGFGHPIDDRWCLHYHGGLDNHGFNKRTYQPGDVLAPSDPPDEVYEALRAMLV